MPRQSFKPMILRQILKFPDQQELVEASAEHGLLSVSHISVNTVGFNFREASTVFTLND